MDLHFPTVTIKAFEGCKSHLELESIKNKLNQIKFSLIHHSERSTKLETMIKEEEHFF